MPALYLLGHLVAGLLAGWLTLRLGRRPRGRIALAVVAVAAIALGFATQRNPNRLLMAAPALGAHLVYLTNVTFEEAVVFLVLLWLAAPDAAARRRAPWLGLPLLGAALWSYAWYFEPLPPGLMGTVDPAGVCRQTSDDSCSAAAAVTLLHRHGIATTEREMAALCLTRAGAGSSRLGIFRGLAVKARERGLQPRLVQLDDPARLGRLHAPALITVGLRRRTPPELATRMRGYGWSVGSWHTVVVLGTDRTGKWIEVADPSNGEEDWPAEELRVLWDGSAMVLE